MSLDNELESLGPYILKLHVVSVRRDGIVGQQYIFFGYGQGSGSKYNECNHFEFEKTYPQELVS